MRWTHILIVALAVALGGASCASNDTVEIPYSTLKQHITKGDFPPSALTLLAFL